MLAFDRHRLHNLRLTKGYSLAMAARLISMRTGERITRAAVANWEKGRARPSIDSLSALCDLYMVRPDYFFIERPNSLFDRRSVKADPGEK